MKFYIDFEATQFSNEIISIGCISESGFEFYSLVNTNKKLTDFIVKLTGITQEDIDNAPDVDMVFSRFFNFVQIASKNELPEFIVYGNSDKNFCSATFKKCKTFKAKSMLSYLSLGVTDAAPAVKKHFGLIRPIGLVKVASYYLGEEWIQKHNSLEDAKMLKYVMEKVESNPIELDCFPEYAIPQEQKLVEKKKPLVFDGPTGTVYRYKRGKNPEIIETYPSMKEAIDYCFTQIQEKDKGATTRDNVKRKIKSAHNKPTKQYMSFYWRIA